MAGRRNQRQLAALHLLRDRATGQDQAIAAWQHSLDTVTAADAELTQLRADYDVKLAALRTKRAEAASRSDRLLGAVAILVGDDKETARLLGVSLHHVGRARSTEHGARMLRVLPGPKDLPAGKDLG